jgi:hypothetical protein
MLKYMIASLALTVGLIHPSIASESKTVRTDLVCTTIENLDKVLTEHGEEAALTMVSMRETRKGVIPNALVFFMNPKTKSWTLVEKFSETEYCIVALGQEVNPYFPEEEKKNLKNKRSM